MHWIPESCPPPCFTEEEMKCGEDKYIAKVAQQGIGNKSFWFT